MDILETRHAARDLPLQQSAEFEQALARLGRQVRRVAIRQGSTQLGEMLMIRRYGVWMASRGPHLAQPPCAHLGRALRREGLWLVNSDTALPGYLQIMRGATIAEMRLDADWRARLLGKWAYHLRRGQRLAPKRHHARFDPVRDRWLLTAGAEMARQRGYRHWPAALTIAYAAANPGRVRVFWADGADGPLGGVMILRHGTRASYHIGWASAEGKTRDITRALLADAADYLTQNGTSQLDIGLIDTEGAPGLARFKIETGAALRQLSGTWIARPSIGLWPRPAQAASMGEIAKRPRP